MTPRPNWVGNRRDITTKEKENKGMQLRKLVLFFIVRYQVVEMSSVDLSEIFPMK